MSLNLDETIAALASPPGPALRGIVRISGHDTVSVLQQILDRHPTSGLPSTFDLRTSRRYERMISVPECRATLPVAVCLWPTIRSFTGEPLAELHLIGSPPLLNEVLERAFTSGARPAERGEFTLRAFLAGRIDLVQAEAVLGVIDAANQGQLETALDQLAGGISHTIGQVREDLLLHLADLEAGLDFVEEDIDFVQRPEFLHRLTDALEMVGRLLDQSDRRMQSTGRYRVVLGGLPNAGKSTLFNQLAGRPDALVSPVSGTTRDYLIVALEHRGVEFDLLDTAGWDDARNGIDQAAAELRNDQVRRADLVLWCTPTPNEAASLSADRELLEACRQLNPHIVNVTTKADLACIPALADASLRSIAGETSMDQDVKQPSVHDESQPPIRVSAQTGEGIAGLLDAIAAFLSVQSSGADVIGSTAARCRESLVHSQRSLKRARTLMESNAGDELIALELRGALDHLGRIVGSVYTDDILDRIFSRFCIGK